MILQYLVDFLNLGDLYLLTVDTNNQAATTTYLQSFSKDVRFVKKLPKVPKKAKGNRHLFAGTRIIDCHYRKDKISTFKAAKDIYSDDRYSMEEDDECTYETLEEGVWTTIARFQSIESGDIIREISKAGIAGSPKIALCNPNLVNDKFRITIIDSKPKEGC